MTQRQQKGAALVTAMLFVALISTLISATLWQQWRQVEIEIAERSRSQTTWLMTGAFDWTRLILREDALSSQGSLADHLSEPWALPLQESKLSTFLSQDQKWEEGDAEVYLSGRITDAQSRMNIMNLIEDGQISPAALGYFTSLFKNLNLPLEELETIVQSLKSQHLLLTTNKNTNESLAAPLIPLQNHQLIWLGLSPNSLLFLENFITILPQRTPLNLNTASIEVLMANFPGLGPSAARQLIAERSRQHWSDLNAARNALGSLGNLIDERHHSTKSQFFQVEGRMRIDNVVQQEKTLMHRENENVKMIWRIHNINTLDQFSNLPKY